MPQEDAFGDWLEKFTYLSLAETVNLPDWQHPIAFIHQFSMNSMGDGTGSLFYNNPECIDAVARSFGIIGEPMFEHTIKTIDEILGPRIQSNPQDWQEIVLQEVQTGAAATAVSELDIMLDERWEEMYSKLESYARSHGWKS